MGYAVLLDEDAAQPYYESLDAKSRRIVRDNLNKLPDDPYPRPGSGLGDVERIRFRSTSAYRLYIGRSHTAMYTIQEDEKRGLVHALMDIDEAHKEYGF